MTVRARLERRPAAAPSVVRHALIRFALLGFATLLILSAVTVIVSRQIARDEAIRDARMRSEAIARSIASPLVNQAVRDGDPHATRMLGAALEARMLDDSVSHIVVWDTQGRILWADDPEVVGTRFTMPEQLSDVTRTEGAWLADPGERGRHPGRDDDEDDLLEFYVRAHDADRVPFVFEAYIPTTTFDQDYRAILRELLPISLGLLFLLQLSTLPLAVSLARRIDRANARRSTILKRSLQSWHEERRGLAQDLHDGVIQDLSAISYALPALIDQLPEAPEADAARTNGRTMNGLLERDLAALRSMVIDLAPAELDGPGLAATLESLAGQATDAGLDVSLSVDPDVEPMVGETGGGLIYRVVREGLRNIKKHAGASAVVVEVRHLGGLVEILVSDDGRGLSPASTRPGHDGLRLLGLLVRDLGGTLRIDGGPHGGAVLRVTFPVLLPDLDERI